MYPTPDLTLKMTDSGKRVCCGRFVLAEERNNFSRHVINLRALASVIRNIGWKSHILVLGGGTDHEAAYFPLLDIIWDEEAKKIHDEILVGQKNLISKQGVQFFPELQQSLVVDVQLYSDVKSNVEYQRDRYSPEPDMELQMHNRFARVMRNEFGVDTPDEELLSKIYCKYLERYSNEGAALDAEYSDYIFLETEEPKTITFWYKFENVPALHAYHRLEEGHHFNFEDI